MNHRGLRKLLLLFAVGAMFVKVVAIPVTPLTNSKAADGEPTGFYGRPMLGVLMSQIDGDQASGYNKLGFQVGMSTGFRWQGKGINALEMQMALAERGSRRAFDAETMVNEFHIRCRQIELQLNAIRPFSVGGLGAVDLVAGLRAFRVLDVRETQGYNPGIANDFRKNGLMIHLGVGRTIDEHWHMRVGLDYSVNSLVKGGAQSIFYPTGVYHNGMGAKVFYKWGG
jgi:hypothetical protein